MIRRAIALCSISILIATCLGLAVASGAQRSRAESSSYQTNQTNQPVPRARTYLIAPERTVRVRDLPIVNDRNRKAFQHPLHVRHPAAYRAAKSSSASSQIRAGANFVAMPQFGKLSASFAGEASAEDPCNCQPPDSQVAAGPNHVFEAINTDGLIFDKAGNRVKGPFDLGQFFGVADNFDSDPRIAYDAAAGRWYVSMISFDSPTSTCVNAGQWDLAVSESSDPTGAFVVYHFPTTIAATGLLAASFPDFDGLGFSDDKIVLSGNAFDCAGQSYRGNEFVVFNKADVMSGSMTHTSFFPPDQDPSTFAIRPAKSRSSTSTLFMGSAFSSDLTLYSVTGIPGIDAGAQVSQAHATITPLVDPPNAIQKGSNARVTTNDSRLLDAVYRDDNIWFSATDACIPTGDSMTRSCLRYIAVNTADMSVVQDFDFGTASTYYYYPAIELDSADDLISPFTRSSSSEFPSAYFAVQLSTDPTDSLQSPQLIHAATTSYSGSRWGDYSGAGVDPSDESQVWLNGEITSGVGNGNWGTWIAEVSATGGTPSPSPTPTGTDGRIRLSNARLAFGAVPVNTGKPRTLTIKNSGSGDLSVTVVQSAAPFNVAASGTFLIPAGNSLSEQVTFSPTAIGRSEGSIAIASSDPKHPSKMVSLVGRGK
jgi:hypothetical protein